MINKESLFKHDEKLATAIFGQACYRCAYMDHGCKRPNDKSCLDGITEWLHLQAKED